MAGYVQLTGTHAEQMEQLAQKFDRLLKFYELELAARKAAAITVGAQEQGEGPYAEARSGPGAASVKRKRTQHPARKRLY